MVARRRDERRPTGRRRLREVAAIATALLVVPIAAILGLKLPLDASGVLAPIFDLPRTAFGHVRSASDGPVELSGPPPGGVAATPGHNQAFAPPRLHRHRPPRVVEPMLVDRGPAPANDWAKHGSTHDTPEAPTGAPAADEATDNGSGTASPDDPPSSGLERPRAPEPIDRPAAKPPVGGPWSPSTPTGSDDSAEAPTPPTGDEPTREPTGPGDDQTDGSTDEASDPPSPDVTGEPGGSPSDPGAPEGEPESLSTGGGQAPGTGDGAEVEPPSGSTDQPAEDESGLAGDEPEPVGAETEPPEEPGDAAGDPGASDDSTETDDSSSVPEDPAPGLEDEQHAGDEGIADETGGDPAEGGQGDTVDDGNAQDNGNGNGNGNGNDEEGCYGSGRGHANGNGNGNCPGQGVANGHDPTHHGAGQSTVLASPLLLVALAGCARRVRPRRARAA